MTAEEIKQHIKNIQELLATPGPLPTKEQRESLVILVSLAQNAKTETDLIDIAYKIGEILLAGYEVYDKMNL